MCHGNAEAHQHVSLQIGGAINVYFKKKNNFTAPVSAERKDILQTLANVAFKA